MADSIHHSIHRPRHDLPRPAARHREMVGLIGRSWLARQDSNLEPPDPESGAIPLGHAPAMPGGLT
jgi:hypothetical protein